MRESIYDHHQPGDVGYGQDGADYVFYRMSDLELALENPEHQLHMYSDHIRRESIGLTIPKGWVVRVSFDVDPPFIELMPVNGRHFLVKALALAAIFAALLVVIGLI
jgi:hypothetical protein